MPNLPQNIKHVRDRIESSANLVGKNADRITLLAVSKRQSATSIREAWQAGIADFGENYVQEAMAKMAELRELPITWHFIGPLQSNKTRPVAEHFAWVHSLDRVSIAERLDRQRPADLPRLQCCLQVNLDAEASKAGAEPEEVLELARAVVTLHRLELRGLMAVPAPRQDRQSQRAVFSRLAGLLVELQRADSRLAGLDTLSMGMSGDLEAAIAEGATIVRVGTDIFGARQ